MTIKIGDKAPNLEISEWVQGLPSNIDKHIGKVILIEVFQVNCPGCFMYGIPDAINVYKKFSHDDVIVLGLATAFEDYDKNTLDNLKLLLSSGEVIGETYNMLSQYGQLINGNKLSYKIPFPVAMDRLKKIDPNVSKDKIIDFITENVPNYESYSENDKKVLYQRVYDYLRTKEYSASTFEEYSLQGTPSAIIVDRNGILRHKFFGVNGYIDNIIQDLVNE